MVLEEERVMEADAKAAAVDANGPDATPVLEET